MLKIQWLDSILMETLPETLWIFQEHSGSQSAVSVQCTSIKVMMLS